MRIDTLINTKTKHNLLELSLRLKRTSTDEQRALVKGNFFADEIHKIRHLSKRELVGYINELKDDKGVKLGTKIAHSSSNYHWNNLDKSVKEKLEILNYARNRLYFRV